MSAKSNVVIEPDSRGTVKVYCEEGTEYVCLYLPDGTIIDVSVDPGNGKNHIKLYDDNDYAILPMDEDSRIRDLDVWNGPVKRSNRRGTWPGETTTVESVEE